MASVGLVEIDAGRYMARATIKVRVVNLRRLRMRLWIARQLFGLGGWVSGASTEIDVQFSEPVPIEPPQS